MVKELFPCKYLVWGGGQKIKQFQLFWRHVHRFPFVYYRVIRLVDDQVRILHISAGGLVGRLVRLETAQHSFYPCNQLLGIKWLDHVIICTQLQPQHLIKNLALGREHDNGHI